MDHPCEFVNEASQVPIQVYQEIGVVKENLLMDLVNPANSAKMMSQMIIDKYKAVPHPVC